MPKLKTARATRPPERNTHPRQTTRIPPADHPVESYDGRLRGLLAYTPENLTDDELALIRPVCVDLASRIPANNHRVDRNRLHHLYALARWCLETTGSFDPNRHMSETTFDLCVTATSGTSAAARGRRSALRMIKYGQTYRPSRDYHPTEPYTAAEWNAFEQAAADLTGTRWATIAWILLTLTGLLGMRASEATTARGTDLTDGSRGLYLHVPAGAGQERLLPVVGAAATHLRPLAGTPGHLLFNEFAQRGNVTSYLSNEALPATHQVFRSFDAERARRTWVAHLVVTMPLRDVQYLAGLGSRTYLAHDIAKLLGPPPAAEVRARYLSTLSVAA